MSGKQEGAQVSYNPHKPGRPSHALYTYWVGNLRFVLDVLVCPGKARRVLVPVLPGSQRCISRQCTPQRQADGAHRQYPRS